MQPCLPVITAPVPYLRRIVSCIGLMLALLWLAPSPCRAADKISHPFVGVSIQRIVRSSPRPQIIHLVTIDPQARGIRFLVTPANGDPNGAAAGDPNHETTRETTLAFARQTHAQLAINTSFFTFIKHTLDTDNISLVASDGHLVSPLETDRPWVLNITADNHVQIRKLHVNNAGKPRSGLYNAVAGSDLLVRDGKVVAPTGTDFDDKHPPRTAVGMTAHGKLLLMTIDGRQPGFAEGMSLQELGRFLLAHGAVDALNLDGGGSTTMVVADPEPRVINFPSDHKADGKPGKLRAVGVNLAVFARPNQSYKPLPRIHRPQHTDP